MEEYFPDLWVNVVGGDALRLHSLPVCGRGTGRGMGWGKRKEQWVMEITQSYGPQWKCVGRRLPKRKSKPPLVRHDLPPRSSKARALKQPERNIGGIISEWGKGGRELKAIFINKERWCSSLCDLVGIKWFCCVLVFSCLLLPTIIKVTLQKAGSSPWHIYQITAVLLTSQNKRPCVVFHWSSQVQLKNNW